jgi:tetratricopeptide (TPR) repeat protein
MGATPRPVTDESEYYNFNGFTVLNQKSRRIHLLVLNRFSSMAFLFLFPVLVTLGPEPSCLARAMLSSSTPLDLGFRQMYNLQFEEAHRSFGEWEQLHPDDPLGPASDAAAYLFSELDRLGVLQWKLFLDDEKFKQRRRLAPDPVTRQAFDKALARSEQVADGVLARSPQDGNALLAKIMDLGLRSDYLALIEKRYLASLGYMKSAGILAEKLLAIDPSYYDAYLAVGIENYILGLKPVPVRWVLRIYGAQTNKDQGIDKLRLTAEKGHYLRPFAQLLLAVAALRDKDRNQAKELLAGLAGEFPNNRLYQRELDRLQSAQK